MALGHLDPSAGVLLQLRDSLAALANNSARHHRGHQNFEVVCRLHCCKKTRDYGLFRVGSIWGCDLYSWWFCYSGMNEIQVLLAYSYVWYVMFPERNTRVLTVTKQKMYIVQAFLGMTGKSKASNRNKNKLFQFCLQFI